MTTITFKVAEFDALRLRAAARRNRVSVSEYLRRQIRHSAMRVDPIKRTKCRYTGALVFNPAAGKSAFTTRDVKSLLMDFP